MNKPFVVALVIGIIILDFGLLLWIFVGSNPIPLLRPSGLIAQQQRDLMISSVAIMLFIVVPVLSALVFVVWKYREGNPHAKYSPEQKTSKFIEPLWWIAPSIIILVLSAITWGKTHELDPYKSISAAKNPIKIQVVALQWKWLFIYPHQNIASVNFVHFPANAPVVFELTADGPMSSFWIPSLSGQMYAMTGMGTKLNVLANKTGEFRGSSAEISGKGFSGMKFVAKSSSEEDFNEWVTSIQQSPELLTHETYEKLAQPSQNNPTAFYRLGDPDLYNKIIAKFANH